MYICVCEMLIKVYSHFRDFLFSPILLRYRDNDFKTFRAEWYFRRRGQLTFTRPTINDDLGQISFWPDASFLVCHGGDLSKINVHICTSVSLLQRSQFYLQYFQYFDLIGWFTALTTDSSTLRKKVSGVVFVYL